LIIIPYQIKQRAGDLDIAAENLEKSRHTDFNKDMTYDGTNIACSKDSAGFMDSNENK